MGQPLVELLGGVRRLVEPLRQRLRDAAQRGDPFLGAVLGRGQQALAAQRVENVLRLAEMIAHRGDEEVGSSETSRMMTPS